MLHFPTFRDLTSVNLKFQIQRQCHHLFEMAYECFNFGIELTSVDCSSETNIYIYAEINSSLNKAFYCTCFYAEQFWRNAFLVC